jgi:hypothetical protein
MDHDKWLMDLMEALRKARTRQQVLAVIERLEDHYDAFSGPGEEMVDNLLAQARRRLDEFPAPPQEA